MVATDPPTDSGEAAAQVPAALQGWGSKPLGAHSAAARQSNVAQVLEEASWKRFVPESEVTDS